MEQGTTETPSANGSDGDASQPPLNLGSNEVKRGRGRPPGSTNKNRPINLASKAEAGPLRASDAESMESAKFVGAALVSLVELGETLVHNSCSARITKRVPHRSEEFARLLDKYRLTDKEREMISASMEKIALKHDLLSKFGPEVVLAVALGQFGLRQMSLIKFVENVTAEKKERNVETEPLKQPANV